MLIQREQYLRTLRQFRDKDVIKVATGVRRCGKSTLFKMFRDELLSSGVDKTQIIDINFESPRYLLETVNWRDLWQDITERVKGIKQAYIFLDEIQNIPEFEKLVDGLFVEPNIDLYITGSNAYFLSGELATLLTGRYVEIKMLPLSFAEYVTAFPHESNMRKLYEQYINFGSFPYVTEIMSQGADAVDKYLQSIYETVFYKDIIARLNPENETKLSNVVKFLMDNIGSVASPRKIADTMTSNGDKISHPTVDSYIESLAKSYLVYQVNRYDIRGKKILQRLGKYYLVDIGLRQTILGRTTSGDRGHILENVVYLELLRRHRRVWIGKDETREIDFVVQTKSGDTEYYQVAETVLSEDTRAREFRPLNGIKDHSAKYILTFDDGNYSDNGIKQINVIDWLLG
ncbi:MAG: ATP-binding protein [Candidatus Nomurabacteria bacterium]|jgi:predicted AAA+ superfamily ATPase|nr:ATP-binding protein [Candidatus Nomurabacteria bacterium]